MITKRLAILAFVILGGLSSVFFLPKVYHQPFGVVMKLPPYLGDWHGKEEEVTKKEREVLGKETEFARAEYSNPYVGVKNYSFTASIILSGHDMSNSIHRPERCLSAQGWNLASQRTSTIKLGADQEFPISELVSARTYRTKDGKEGTVRNLACYWFVGAEEITASHWGRTLIDNRDRFLKGVNQRWAYVLISGVIPETNPGNEEKAAEWTREKMRNFITKLAPRIHDPKLKY